MRVSTDVDMGKRLRKGGYGNRDIRGWIWKRETTNVGYVKERQQQRLYVIEINERLDWERDRKGRPWEREKVKAGYVERDGEGGGERERSQMLDIGK